MKKEIQAILIAIMTKLMNTGWILRDTRFSERYTTLIYAKDNDVLSIGPANNGVGPVERGNKLSNSVFIYFKELNVQPIISEAVDFQLLLDNLDYILEHKALPISLIPKETTNGETITA